MEVKTMVLGFLGGGNMAEAILAGIVKAGILKGEQILVSDPSAERRASLEQRFAVGTTASNLELMASSDAVMFAVKPQMMSEVMAEVAPHGRGNQLFLSICAGLRAETIEAGLRCDGNPNPRLVRIMPNTPALVGEGIAGISKGSFSTDADLELAAVFFRAVGEVVLIEENQMDGLTAVTGSGPAYVFLMMESLIDAAIERGFSREQATQMVLQLFRGAALLAHGSDRSPAELRAAVTSKGGTTHEGIETLKAKGFPEAISACVAASERRSKELSGS